MKPSMKKSGLFDAICFGLLFALLLFMAFDLNYKKGKPTGPGVFYSDKSQYYMYLPATFIYGWDHHKIPPRADTMYAGFCKVSKTKKICMKMTCGVAVLATPFFLMTHGAALLSGVSADGFSEFYEKMGLIAPVFYLVLGLFFMKRFLEKYFRRTIAWLSVLFVLFGTNLFYYGLVEGWMSHVFSFSLFALFLYLLKAFLDGGKKRFSLFLMLSFVAALAILVRPTAILILIAMGLLDVRSFREVGDRIRFFFRPKYLLSFIGVAMVVFLPQFIYWHYFSGSFIFYSYGQETFLLWNRPMFGAVWFAQLNGLFTYTPLFFFIMAGIVMMIIRKISNGWFLALMFFLISYVTASWHMWFFGGSYGARPFVEYYAFFVLAFAYILESILKLRNLFIRNMILLTMLLLVLFNQRIISVPRWNTASIWAWDDLRDFLSDNDVVHFEKRSYTYINDFENYGFHPSILKTRINVHSPTEACMLYPVYEFGCVYTHSMNRFLEKPVEKIEVSCMVDPFVSDSSDALMVCILEHQTIGKVYYRAVPFNSFKTRRGAWTKISTTIPIPAWINDPAYTFRFYIWNIRKKHLILDDIRIRFE